MFQVNKCKQRAKEMFSDQQGGKRGRKYRETSQNCPGREVEGGRGKRGRASTDAYTGPWKLMTRTSSLGFRK